MKIDFDKKIDTKYIRIKEGKISMTRSVEDWLFVDLSEDGSILGVEILNVSNENHNVVVSDHKINGVIIQYKNNVDYVSKKIISSGKKLNSIINETLLYA